MRGPWLRTLPPCDSRDWFTGNSFSIAPGKKKQTHPFARNEPKSTATEGAPCGSPSHGLPCPLSALCAPHCPCPPRPLPGVASALHVSLLSAWPPSHTAAGVCLCGPPTPSPLGLLPFQTVRPPISWFPTRLPSQGSLRSPRHEAVRWRGHVAECQLSSAVICVGSAMVSTSEPPVSPAPGRHRRAFQP